MAFFSLTQVVRISRPRFWIYLVGPYALGVLSAFRAVDAINTRTILLALFFTLPANFFLYGINDLFDYETDKLNPKKQGYEALMKPSMHAAMRWGGLGVLFGVALLMTRLPLRTSLLCVLFLFLSYFYSAPPIRAKARPLLDSLFNILYLIPGLIGFSLVSAAPLSWTVMIAASCWCMAMHAYSAVPDRSADTQAGVQTIATMLGKTMTLVLCTALYTLAAVLTWKMLGLVSVATGSVYVILMGITSTRTTPTEELAVYRVFPWINTLVGMALFFTLLLHRW